MKTIFSFTIIATLFFVGCQKDAQKVTSNNVRANSANSVESAPGVVPSDIGLNEIVLHPSDHTWKDLDQFYRTVVLNHQQDSYFISLKKMTINSLIMQFDLLEKADLKTIEFYIHEQETLDLVYPEVFVKSLERMKGHWSNEKIRHLALKKYSDGISFIKNNLKDPDSFMKENGSKFEAIKSFAESIPLK